MVLRIERIQTETRAFPMLANPGSAPDITCAHTLGPSPGLRWQGQWRRPSTSVEPPCPPPPRRASCAATSSRGSMTMKGLFMDAVDDLAAVFRQVVRPDDPHVDVQERGRNRARRAARPARRLRLRAGRPHPDAHRGDARLHAACATSSSSAPARAATCTPRNWTTSASPSTSSKATATPRWRSTASP